MSDTDAMLERARAIMADERNRVHLGKWAEALLAVEAARAEAVEAQVYTESRYMRAELTLGAAEARAEQAEREVERLREGWLEDGDKWERTLESLFPDDWDGDCTDESAVEYVKATEQRVATLEAALRKQYAWGADEARAEQAERERDEAREGARLLAPYMATHGHGTGRTT